MGAFEWFQRFCLETKGEPVKVAAVATEAGWQDSGGGFETDGATVEQVLTSPDQTASVLVLTLPASALNFGASGRVCFVGEVGAVEANMTRTLREWTGFAPESDGGFEFWAYSTVAGERRPERGLMRLSAEDLIARVRDEGIQVIGVMPSVDGPAFASVTPF